MSSLLLLLALSSPSVSSEMPIPNFAVTETCLLPPPNSSAEFHQGLLGVRGLAEGLNAAESEKQRRDVVEGFSFYLGNMRITRRTETRWGMLNQEEIDALKRLESDSDPRNQHTARQWLELMDFCNQSYSRLHQ